MSSKNFNLIRLVACILTLLLLFGKNYFPKKVLDIHPDKDTIYTLYSDSNSGGNSKAEWIDKENGHWKCTLIKSQVYPVCGLSINFSQIPYKTINAESYNSMQVELEYKGESKKVRIFLRNHNKLYSEKNVVESTKFHFVNLRASDLMPEATINMAEFSVADWWKDEYDIPRSLSKPEFKELISIGIDQSAADEVYGAHEYKLKSIKFTGNWISSEALYIAIIAGWMLVLAFEAIRRLLALRARTQGHNKRLSELKIESDKYKELSNTDALTGVANRVGFAKRVHSITKGDNDQLLGYALMVLDIDHFKSINDKYGHDIGDSVLKEFAISVSNFIRSEDCFARWGGEEFVILAHMKNPNSVHVLSEKIRSNIEASTFEASNPIKVTVSIGVAIPQLGESFDELFKRADTNLYKAKRNGRNQVVYEE